MEHCAMTSADRRASRVLLSLLCAGLTGLVVVTLWAFYAHPPQSWFLDFLDLAHHCVNRSGEFRALLKLSLFGRLI